MQEMLDEIFFDGRNFVPSEEQRKKISDILNSEKFAYFVGADGKWCRIDFHDGKTRCFTRLQDVVAVIRPDVYQAIDAGYREHHVNFNMSDDSLSNIMIVSESMYQKIRYEDMKRRQELIQNVIKANTLEARVKAVNELKEIEWTDDERRVIDSIDEKTDVRAQIEMCRKNSRRQKNFKAEEFLATHDRFYLEDIAVLFEDLIDVYPYLMKQVENKVLVLRREKVDSKWKNVFYVRKSLLKNVMKEFVELCDLKNEKAEMTADRIADFWDEFLRHGATEPRLFYEDLKTNGMVVMNDINFFSVCEHHFLPITGHVDVAYIADGVVIGASKIPRVVSYFASRPQLQERMTNQIADYLSCYLGSEDVAVRVVGEHMCMRVRGPKQSTSKMVTMAVKGVFKENVATRAEFLDHCN